MQHNRYKSSAVGEMGDRGHNRHGPKREGGAVPLSGVSRVPSNTMWPGPRSTSVPSGVFNSSSIQPFEHNRHERKTGGRVYQTSIPRSRKCEICK